VHRMFSALIDPLVGALAPGVVVEVGAGSGRLTRRWLDHTTALVHAIDPDPSFDPDALAGEHRGRLTLHVKPSLSILQHLPPADLVILDGDPNWYTTINELRQVALVARGAERPPPVIVVHHVSWPFGRRDGYYNPDGVPAAYRAPSAASGLQLARSEPDDQGLRLTPQVALKDRGPHSGVRTAIDDFVAEDAEAWRVVDIPGLHGIAILTAARRLGEHRTLETLLDSFEQPEFLAAQVSRVERERIAAMIRGDQAQRGAGVAQVATAPDSPSQPFGAETDPEFPMVEALRWRLDCLERDQVRLLARIEQHEQEGTQLLANSIEAAAGLRAADRELHRRDQDLVQAQRRSAELKHRLALATAQAGQALTELGGARNREQLEAARATHYAGALESARSEFQSARAEHQAQLLRRPMLESSDAILGRDQLVADPPPTAR
jgi:hypothetical protein